jgi:putative endonuclease
MQIRRNLVHKLIAILLVIFFISVYQKSTIDHFICFKGNKAGKRYVGITNDLSRRLSEHRSGHSKAGQIIGKFTVIHTESFTDHKSARLREKFLKSGKGRKWLDMLESTSEPATKPAGKARL